MDCARHRRALLLIRLQLNSGVRLHRLSFKELQSMLNACDALGLESDDAFPLVCVGESHYQAALEAICGPRNEDGEDLEVPVVIALEDTNPYDPQAVRIEVDGRTVGYLSRPDARAYRRALETAGLSEVLGCRGRIRGGWDRGQDDRGSYGIFLDVALYGSHAREA